MKRAAEIAVAGGHNLLMAGPPGIRQVDDCKKDCDDFTGIVIGGEPGDYQNIQCTWNDR